MIFPVLNQPGQDKNFVKMTVDMAWGMAPSKVHKMIVTNYESLNSFSWLMDMPWTVMVVDEAHK
ncbi:hypothetical protein NL339_27465, partial [Klebsiella pneumoniae]|nr:hypothetical protein [Klebsiella pneumoniae]